MFYDVCNDLVTKLYFSFCENHKQGLKKTNKHVHIADVLRDLPCDNIIFEWGMIFGNRGN